MLNKKVIFFVLICTIFTNLFSDDFDDFTELFGDIDMGSENTAESKLTISGEHEFKYTIPYVDTERIKVPVFNNEFKIAYITDNIDIVSIWKLNIADEVITPDENYIKISLENSVFQFGYNIYSWGHADGKNPTDNLNNKDYSNPLNIVKTPSLSLAMTQYILDLSIEAVYIPTETKNLKDFKFGGRVNYYSNVDLSLSYIYDFDLFSDMDRLHRVGLSSKTTLSRFGIWAELNYSIIQDTDNPLEWTAGFDVNFLKDNRAYLNIQSFGTWESELTTGLIGQWSYTLIDEELETELTCIYIIPNSNTDSLLTFKPEIVYEPFDSLELTIGMNISNIIDKNVIYNEIHQNDDIFFSIKYYW